MEVSAEGADVPGIVELVRGGIPILTEQVLGWTEGSSIRKELLVELGHLIRL